MGSAGGIASHLRGGAGRLSLAAATHWCSLSQSTQLAMDARFGASLGRVGSVGWTRRDDADVRMTGREGLDQACVTVRQRASRCAVRTERYPSEDFKRVNYVATGGDLSRSTKCSQLNRFRN